MPIRRATLGTIIYTRRSKPVPSVCKEGRQEEQCNCFLISAQSKLLLVTRAYLGCLQNRIPAINLSKQTKNTRVRDNREHGKREERVLSTASYHGHHCFWHSIYKQGVDVTLWLIDKLAIYVRPRPIIFWKQQISHLETLYHVRFLTKNNSKFRNCPTKFEFSDTFEGSIKGQRRNHCINKSTYLQQWSLLVSTFEHTFSTRTIRARSFGKRSALVSHMIAFIWSTEMTTKASDTDTPSPLMGMITSGTIEGLNFTWKSSS